MCEYILNLNKNCMKAKRVIHFAIKSIFCEIYINSNKKLMNLIHYHYGSKHYNSKKINVFFFEISTNN